jgi:hypothetical protein
MLLRLIGFGGDRFFTGSVCERANNGCLSGVVCKDEKDATESLARRLLSVSFLGVSFLLSDRVGFGSGARLGGVQTGAGEKQLIRVGGSLSAGTLIEGSKGKTPD